MLGAPRVERREVRPPRSAPANLMPAAHPSLDPLLLGRWTSPRDPSVLSFSDRSSSSSSTIRSSSSDPTSPSSTMRSSAVQAVQTALFSVIALLAVLPFAAAYWGPTLSPKTTSVHAFALAGMSYFSLRGVLAGAVVGACSFLTLLLFGTHLGTTASVRQLVGLDGAGVRSRLFPACFLGGLTTAAYIAGAYCPALRARIVHPGAHAITALIYGIGSGMALAPWGTGVPGSKAYLPLALMSAAALLTSYVVRTWPTLRSAVDRVDAIGASFDIYGPNATLFFALVATGFVVRVIARLIARPAAADRHARVTSRAAEVGAAAAIGALYALGMLLLSWSSTVDVVSYFVASAMFGRLGMAALHYLVSAQHVEHPLLVRGPPLAAILEAPDARKHTATLYLGSVLAGVGYGASGAMLGPSLALGAFGVGGTVDAASIVLGNLVGHALL